MSIILDGETIITAILPLDGGFYLIGSRKNNNYVIIIIKMNEALEIEWERTFGPETSDTEGHSASLVEDGLLVCGCSGGKATPTGGQGWKAHLMKLSRSGEPIWERAIRIRGNECAYNVLPGSKMLIFGETKDSEGQGFFLSCLDSEGNVEWTKDHGKYDGVMAGGIIDTRDGFIFSGSVKTGKKWQSRLFGVGMTGETEWMIDVACERIFQMRSVEGGFIMVGERSGNIFLARADYTGNMLWEQEFGAGTGISVFPDGEKFLLGGENRDGNPIVCRIGPDGFLIRRIMLEGEGWIEAISKYNERIVLARHIPEPRERTEIIFVDF